MATQATPIKSTLARRLAIRIAITGVLLGSLALLVMFPIRRHAAKTHAIVDAGNLAEAVAVIYTSLDPSKNMSEAEKILLRVARTPHIAFINILDTDGTVLYSTINEHIGKIQSIKSGIHEEGELLIVTNRLSRGSGLIGAVLIASEISTIYAEFYRNYLMMVLAVFIVVVFLTLMSALVVERLVGRRLTRLGAVVESAEHGFFLARANVDHMDEVGLLALEFNKLLSTITHLQVKEIEREKDLSLAKEQLSIKEELERTARELKQSNKTLHRRVKAQELLMDAAHLLGATLNKKDLLSRLASLLSEKMGWPDFAIFLTEEDENKEKILRFGMASGALDVPEVLEISFHFGDGVTGTAAQTAAPIVVEDITKESGIKILAITKDTDKLPEFCKSGSLLAVPMLFQGRVIGVMDIFSREKQRFDEEDVALSHALGAQVAIAIVNSDLYEATLELATSDPLTGILNRRAMQRQLESEIARAERFQTKFSCLMIDVDHFKSYNDRMGHVLGDAALKKVAQSLKSELRKVDTVSRFGGEEFCVILPLSDIAAAKDVAHKLCQAINQVEIRGSNTQPLGFLSISVGISVYPDALPASIADIATTLIQKADAALYAAKRAGRNGFVSYDEIKHD